MSSTPQSPPTGPTRGSPSAARSRTRRLLTVLATAALAVGLVLAWVQRAARELSSGPGLSAEAYAARPAPAGQALPALWEVPAFSFQDQQGRRFGEGELRGRVWVADFIFTTCTSVCPLLSAQLAQVMRELPDPELRFVSFSVDPEHYTSEVLRAYAERWRPDEPRWTLLATDPTGLKELAAGMHVSADATGDADNPILHSGSFFLVDAAGQVRGVYTASDPSALDRLVADARALRSPAGADPAHSAPTHSAPPDPDADGATLYSQLGCGGCHENPALAPSLVGLVGAEVPLAGGATRRGDAAYVRDSLLTPGRELRAGYLNLMPGYGDRLSAPELDRLVTHVLALGSAGAGSPTAPSSAEAPAFAEDPVCHMQVRVTPETPKATAGGHAHYFCSERCREQFLANRSPAQR